MLKFTKVIYGVFVTLAVFSIMSIVSIEPLDSTPMSEYIPIYMALIGTFIGSVLVVKRVDQYEKECREVERRNQMRRVRRNNHMNNRNIR